MTLPWQLKHINNNVEFGCSVIKQWPQIRLPNMPFLLIMLMIVWIKFFLVIIIISCSREKFRNSYRMPYKLGYIWHSNVDIRIQIHVQCVHTCTSVSIIRQTKLIVFVSQTVNFNPFIRSFHYKKCWSIHFIPFSPISTPN